MKHLVSLVTFGLMLGTAAPVIAQRANPDKQPNPARQKDTTQVPADARPPKGMCRIWIDGVPPGQQPAPTDCSSAIRNRPANARVLFGDDYGDSSKADDRKRKPRTVKGFPVKSFVPHRPPSE